MKNKSLLFISLGLGICAAILLIDRFVVSIPDWVAILFIIVALVFVFISFFLQRKNKMKRD